MGNSIYEVELALLIGQITNDKTYWDRYINGLIDFIKNENLTDEEIIKIAKEINSIKKKKKEIIITQSQNLKETFKIERYEQ